MTEGGPLDERVARLREAVVAARSVGLEEEAAAARAVVRRIRRRAGFGGSVYVLALAGGTGVGKSSVLNALAGREVSPARAVRPATDAPLAWVPADRRSELEPLLDWLKVATVVPHDDIGLDEVAILDLPDMDSVRVEHRATVDALLPRIDALTWIVDPEKYDDAREHFYWRALAPHADRLRFVLNKVDRLTDADAELVADDLRARLVADGIERPIVQVVSAATGAGIAALREDLSEAGQAKVIVAAKLEEDRALAAERLARSVGIEPGTGYQPLLPASRRDAHAREAIDGALQLVDTDGLSRQVRSAILHWARVEGGSSLGRLIAIAWTLSGRHHRQADPAAYLRAWRSRGARGRLLNPLRAAMVEAVAAAPASSRGRLMDALGVQMAEPNVARILDRAVATASLELQFTGSRVWSLIGAMQTATGALLVFSVAWIVVLFVAGGVVPVGTFDAPVLGPIPIPLMLFAASVLASGILGWVLGLHAGAVGRAVAARVISRTEAAVREAVVEAALAGLDRVEAARGIIAAAVERRSFGGA